MQYSTALAITGAWRGTSRERIYRELGWESLYSRRWSRRLFMLYKIIPKMNQSNYNLRNQPVIGQIRARTDKYKASFFPDSLLEWSKLDPEIRQSPSINVFKSRLLSLIRPSSNSIFGIYDPQGLAFLTQLRVGLSKLHYHNFTHNFCESINPMCPIKDGMEDAEHFLLLCHSFRVQRYDLLASVLPVLRYFD